MSYRLIDSNAIAIKYPEVNEMPCVFANLPDGMNGQFIDAQPERKIGKWITKEEDYTKQTYCSECGKNAPFIFVADDYYGNYAHGETIKTNFCPNCGADMRGEA